MDLDQLRAFISIAKKGSFSAAAEELKLTQPAISKRLAALEADLNGPLLERFSRSIRLTQAGRILLPKAEQIIQEVDRAKKTVIDLAGGVAGELHIATSHHLGLHKLPPVLRAYCALYPDVNLQIEFLDSEVALARVAKGRCELAVITLPPAGSDELVFTELWADPLCFVTNLNSPLRSATTLAQLSASSAILPDLNTYTGRLIKECFAKHNLPLNVNMATNYLETIKMMVSVGLGWSVLPQSMLDSQLQAIPIKDVQLTRKLGTVTHPRRTLSNAASAFYAMLRANPA